MLKTCDDLTVSQAARLLGLSVSRVRQLTDAGELVCRRTALGRLISPGVLEDYALGRGMSIRRRSPVLDPTKIPDADLLDWARRRIANDLDMLVKFGATGEAKLRVDLGTLFVTDPAQRRTWVAATAVLDSGDLTPTLN